MSGSGEITIRTAGATGTTQAATMMFAEAFAAAADIDIGNTTASSIDFTGTLKLAIFVTFSTDAADNGLLLNAFNVQHIQAA